MSKTEKKMDANAASEKAKENLIKNLMHLQGQIDSMLSVAWMQRTLNNLNKQNAVFG